MGETINIAALAGKAALLGCLASSLAGCSSSPDATASGTSPVPAELGISQVQTDPGAAIQSADDRLLLHYAASREQALDLLERAAFSDSALMRANAIEGLSVAPARIAPIARAALYDTNPGVRFVAAMTIGELKLDNDASVLERLLIDPEPRVRAAGIYALWMNGFEPDPTPLADMLWHPNMQVRSQAAFVLGEMGIPSAASMLRAAAKDDAPSNLPQDRIFRLQIAEAICKLGDRSAAHTIQVALYPSNREDFEAAVLAAQILGELKDQESVQQLINLVETTLPGQPVPAGNNKNTVAEPQYLYPPELRLAAATSLARMGYPDGAYVADGYLDSPSPMLRSQSCFLFAQARRPGDLATLEAMMNGDGSDIVRISAAAGLLQYLDGAPDL